jgi:predicted NBD/HSP70 family sugar kinase
MYISIDIGGTHTRVARGEKDQISQRTDFPTQDFPETLQKIKTSVLNLSSNKQIDGIGVSVVGPLNFVEKRLLRPTHLPNWEGVEIKKELESALGRQVFIAHDAATSGYGEWKYGAGKGSNPLLYYTISTGIGIGLIVDGKIFHGVYNIEAGHQILDKTGPLCPCGQHGDLDIFLSGKEVEKRTGKSSKELEGSETWDEMIDRLAIGITNSILHYSPEKVVVGGAQTHNQPLFYPPLERAVAQYLKHTPIVPILPSQFRDNSGLIGAFALAEDKVA